MPGQQLRQKFEKRIEELGGDHVVFDMIAGGMKMEAVASAFRGFLESHPDFPSRQWMYTWIKAGGEERREAWQEAKRIASHCILDDIDEEIEDANPVTSAEVSYLKLRAQRAEARAAAFNPEEYGDKKDEGVNINVDLGSLYLGALREKGSMKLAPGRNEEPEMLEAEVIEEDG